MFLNLSELQLLNLREWEDHTYLNDLLKWQNKILKAMSRKCSILIVFQGVTIQTASNPTGMIGQFLGSDETL